jgi:C-terminal processing protease CtpA/Prc
VTKYRSDITPNFDFAVVDRDLTTRNRIGSIGVVGRTSDGFGYVRVTTLKDVEQRRLNQLMFAIEGQFDAPGMIVDLRANSGGAEIVGMEVASLFADRPRDYARQKFRSGPDHNDFAETERRRISPRQGTTYAKPVVCLIGPGAISSAEGMALMFKALPHCTLIGKPTRGASGNPMPVQLPNGVDVYFSRWVSMELDGTPIENRGVLPDIDVEHKRGSDATYEKANDILKRGGQRRSAQSNR